jgi:CubicO group peptidase (beta-lactamase class C family)
MSKGILSALIFLFVVTGSLAADHKNEEPKAAQSVADLRHQLEQILKETHTPGVSVAIVRKDGPEWVAGVGIADVASNRPAGADTLFRIGSTSKAFASLSILKLAREGKLSLDDPIRKYVPGMAFENRWEATDPVRIVHLLEHTTGWDDMHLKEYAKDAPGMDLRTALEFGRASRVSRWPPGTRMAYCNTGPTVAAYIVEKITGQRFEDYVQQNLFGPIGMKSATYFEPPAGTGTTLYHGDGKTPYPYWNIIYRPAGSINASANDMAPYVQFYLNRGTVNGVVVTPAAEIDRMESPASTWAAKDGLKSGYGLGNYWTIQDGFVYHGHTGGVDGGLTELAYMPEYGVGYFFSINSGNFDAFGGISKAIRSYITLKLQRPAVPAPAPLPSNASDYAGWYEPNAPRQQMLYFMDRIKGISRVRFESGKMIIITGIRRKRVFVPVSGRQFRYLPDDGAPEPAASVALLTPNREGRFIEAGTTLRHLPPWLAWAEAGLLAYFDLAMIAIVVYAPFWIIGGFFKKRRRPLERAMRLYPLAAVLSLIACMMIFSASGNDFLNRLGQLTPWSAGLFLTTLAFAATTIMGAWSVATAPPSLVRPRVRWFSIAVSLALVIALAYFAYWGVIGVRTWA